MSRGTSTRSTWLVNCALVSCALAALVAPGTLLSQNAPRLEFLILGWTPVGPDSARPKNAWDPFAGDSDLVLLRASGLPQGTRFDSLRLRAKAGPERYCEGCDVPLAGVADSLGRWIPVPRSLLHAPPPEYARQPEIFAALDVRQVSGWVARRHSALSFVTRLQIIAWRGRHRLVAELWVGIAD